MRYCTAISLLVGDGFNFNPKDDTTRAQAASLFMRLHKYVLALEQPAPGEDAEAPSEEETEADPADDPTQDETPESPAPDEPGMEEPPAED